MKKETQISKIAFRNKLYLLALSISIVSVFFGCKNGDSIMLGELVKNLKKEIVITKNQLTDTTKQDVISTKFDSIKAFKNSKKIVMIENKSSKTTKQ